MSINTRVTALFISLLAGLAFSVSSASAAEPAANLSISVVSSPTIFSSEQDGKPVPDFYQLIVANTGSEPTNGQPIVIDDELPTGFTPIHLEGWSNETFVAQGQQQKGQSLACTVASVTCTFAGVLRPGERLGVAVEVSVAPGTVGPVTDTAAVSGGGVAGSSANVVTALGTAAESLTEPFGIASLTAGAIGVNGLPDAQAGDHPYETTVSFSLNTIEGEHENEPGAVVAGGRNPGAQGHLRDTIVDLPPGFVGDPNVVEKCPQVALTAEECPPSTQIGIARLRLHVRYTEPTDIWEPLYNVVPENGHPAEFAIFIRAVKITIPLYVSILPEEGYKVRVTTPQIPETAPPTDVTVTFFGTPATDANAFDEYRNSVKGATPLSFLDNPVDCSTAPQNMTLSADSWEEPGAWQANGQPDLSDPRWKSKTTTYFPSLEGCELLQFNPTLTVTPDTTRADEPAGTTVDVNIPQAAQEFPELITPEFKNTTVTLPSGLSLDPSAGDGLEGCSDAQLDLSSSTAAACPDGSQIGTAKVTTPLLSEPLEGQVFLGTPHCDPCTNADASDGNMYRIFLQFDGSGVRVKQEGHIYANTSTGQLTTVFKETPQLPVSQVQLHFNGGLRAGLATPQACGTFTSTGDITPWSTPITQDATPASQLHVDWDGNGGACPATSPFGPSFSAGTSNPNAGQLSPLTVTFGREDREQDFSQIKVVTPPGLLGSLATVPLCGEPQSDLGTCSSASQIGEMTVAAGPGSHPYYQKGQVYLTGPYKGAPFGLSIVVPTHAGPFNLGNVVVRAMIDVDPVTAALTVTTDPLPQILDGIPLRLRTTNVTINRPGFIFNPTSCAQQHITATVSGSQGAQAQVSTPFAVSGCAGLHFAPKFTVSTSGKTSKAKGASLDAKVIFPAGAQSNIAKVKVDLPKQLPSRLTTLQKACTAKQFEVNPAGCPQASVIGIAKAITPILPVPLTGPVYFVSHGGEAFPSLVVVLQGYGVRVDLTAATFISKKGITSSTFKTIPDVPVSSFELYLPEGKYSALAANGNLCTANLEMPTQFIAQDGAQLKQDTKLTVSGCPKAKAATKKKQKPKAKQSGSTGHVNGRSS